MAGQLAVFCAVLVLAAAAPQQGQRHQPAAQQAPPAEHGAPQIDWGQCQNLQPSETERTAKKAVIQDCLQVVPIPEGNITAQQADKHREDITTCALKAEGWFNADGSYKFDRAKEEIKTKKLQATIEAAISAQHDNCHKEALEKFPQSTVQQVQLYQACMDFHIAQICRIQIITPNVQQQGQGQAQGGQQQRGQQAYHHDNPDYYQQ